MEKKEERILDCFSQRNHLEKNYTREGRPFERGRRKENRIKNGWERSQ